MCYFVSYCEVQVWKQRSKGGKLPFALQSHDVLSRKRNRLRLHEFLKNYLAIRSICSRISDSILPLNIIAEKGNSPSTTYLSSSTAMSPVMLMPNVLNPKERVLSDHDCVKIADLLLKLRFDGFGETFESFLRFSG